jgi:hypothetical protein
MDTIRSLISYKNCSLISRATFSTLPAFILFFIFYFEKEIDVWGITQNWVMTVYIATHSG